MRLCRPFLAAARTKPASPRPRHCIRVVSYNILANKYAISGNHAYCAPQYLKWAYRYPRILEELQRYNADIICLQEVESAVFHQQLQPALQQAGYSSLFQHRAAPSSQAPDAAAADDEGISLHFRDSAFEQIHTERIRFSDYASYCTPPSWLSPGDAPGMALYIRHLARRMEGALLTLLRHRASQRVLLVCCTHLYWNPDYPDVKAAQASILCAAIASLLQQRAGTKRVPVVCAGDFNSMWRKYESDRWDQVPPGRHLTSGVYQLLSRGQLPMNHPDHPLPRSQARSRTRRSRSPGISGADASQQAGPAAAAAAAAAAEVGGSTSGAAAGAGVAAAAAVAGAGATSTSAAAAAVGAAPSGWAAGPPEAPGTCSSSMDDDPAREEEEQQQQQQGWDRLQDARLQLTSMPLQDDEFTSCGLRLVSANMAATGREPAWTNCTATFSATLDYIWLSQGDFQVASTLAMPYEEEEEEEGEEEPGGGPGDLGPIPDADFPSDHLAIGCDLVLLPQ